MTTQMTEKELDQINGGVVLLVVLAASKPSTTKQGRTKLEIHQKYREIPGDMYYPDLENLLPAVQM